MATASAISELASVPIVDFSSFLSGNEAQKQEVAQQVDQAFQDVGFVSLVNHGVDARKVAEAFEWSKKFFALPYETKNLAPHPPGGSHHRGYSGVGLEKVTQHVFDADELRKHRVDAPDVKESFESGNVKDDMQPNIWLPEEALPGFRAFMEDFFEPCASLIHTVLSTLSHALSLPPPGLPPTHAQSLFQLRLLHYPSLPVHVLRSNAAARINAHSDFGTLTLLFQDSVGGLEIQDPHEEGKFRSVPPVDGAVLVNIGDLMERWSNGRWKSTVHRVVAPPLAASASNGPDAATKRDSKADEEICPDRYSIPFFATADPDTVIDALPGCWGDGKPKLYDPVTAEGYVQMRMATLYE